MDFEEAYALFKKNGGSGGDVTKAYVDAQDALKVDKVTGKGLSTNDYTTEDKTAVSSMASVIPVSATPQNLLATSADVSENLVSASASGTSFTLTDATDGIVQGLTVYGKSTDHNGVIKSVGDSQITFTTSNGTSSGTAALSSGIPLRGIPVLNPITETTYTDENGNEWFADEANIYTGKVIKRCGVVDLGTLNWVYNTTGEFFGSNDITELMLPTPRSAICAGYNFVGSVPTADWLNVPTMSFGITTSSTSGTTSIRMKNTDYTNATAFKAAVSGVYLIYQLAVPTETQLSGSELAAFASLRTFEETTNVSAAEQTASFIAPYMDISYLRNTGNGQAAADLQAFIQAQIDALAARVTALENA